MGTPAAEVEINSALVERMLKSQHPDLADLPIVVAGTGWDNAMFRLGEQWAVRLPRRQIGANLVEKEQTWLRRLAPHLTIPAPVPLRIGQPEGEYPWRWSVVPWMAGETVDSADLRSLFRSSTHSRIFANATHACPCRGPYQSFPWLSFIRT